MNSVSGTKKFTRASGSFVTDGFVVGNKFTASGFGGGVDGIYTILTISALEIVVNEAVAGDITGGGDERLIADDELATGGGYTQNTKTTGTVTVTEDDTYDRCDSTFPTVTWTASGANIGPTPGAIIYDTTADVVICYIDFDGEVTKSPPDSLSIGNGTLRVA